MSGGWTFPTRPLYGVQLRPDTDSGYPIHLFRRYLEEKDPAAKRDAALLILDSAPEFNAGVGGGAWGCAVPVSPVRTYYY